MPELPEVESARRALLAWLPGRIDTVSVLDPAVIRAKLSTRPADAVPDGEAVGRLLFEGATIGHVDRHGKRLGLLMGRGRELHAALVHFGMTGRLVRRTPADVPGPSVRLVWRSGDTCVWFEDRRRFGCVVPVRAKQLGTRVREGHGPDALDEPADAATLHQRALGRRAIKDVLMDQAVLAGLGNIHVVEVLWRARLHPETLPNDVAPAAWKRLAKEIPAQLGSFVESLDTEVAYVNLGGPNPFQVYGREGEPCPRCGTAISRLARSRSTYFCAGCQA